ncbi:MAG TPA: cupin domain-containing protein [Vicinamibacterales bacterium]|nr:cupin domain-containing protein [Vicinamibacterales bacterium]
MVKIRNRKTAEHYQWGEACDGWRLLDGLDLAVIQERIPPGAGEVRHFHRHARQFFYVLTGHVLFDIGDEAISVGPGDGVEVAPLQLHRVRNVSDADAVFLVVSSPSTRSDRENT